MLTVTYDSAHASNFTLICSDFINMESRTAKILRLANESNAGQTVGDTLYEKVDQPIHGEITKCSANKLVDQFNETLTYFNHNEINQDHNLELWYSEINKPVGRVCDDNVNDNEADKQPTLVDMDRVENFENNTYNDSGNNDDFDYIDPYATDDEDSNYDPTEDMSDLEETQTENELQADDRPNLEEQTHDSENRVPNNNVENKMSKLLTRKKLTNPGIWRRNVIKKSRNAGRPYKSWKGKDVQERKLKSPCGEKCRLKCSSRISQESRSIILKEYWNLQDVTRQRDFIFRYVDFKQKATERRRVVPQKQDNNEDHGSRRNLTFGYHLPGAHNTEKIKVCQTFFLHTLSISHQVVKTVAKKTENGQSTVASDMRGKVQCNSRLPEEVKQSVRNHIKLFQPIESHYCRKETSKTYLPSSLNIKRMYDLYKAHCSENNLQVATESIYRQIFCREFNISFFVPKKDQCGLCTKYKNSSTLEKIEIQSQYDLHLLNKDLSRESKNKDKERAKVDKKFCAAVFDLQQILPCPKIEVGEAYYKRKLSTYNFTVYNLGNKECFCYMWHEVIASRGACEIGSCLYKFIVAKVERGVTEFSFYSDNCAGQNHNRFIYCLFVHLSKKFNIKLQHNFLEAGHTQNEGDCVHSVIESVSKNIPVYTPSQWCTLVRTASRKNPYQVIEISQEDVFNLKDLLESNTINWDKDIDKQKVLWQRIKVVYVDPQSPTQLHFKYNFSESSYSTIDLQHKGRRKHTFSDNYELKILRPSPIPLTKEKYENLVFFCDKKSIPTEYHNFFRQLPHSTT